MNWLSHCSGLLLLLMLQLAHSAHAADPPAAAIPFKNEGGGFWGESLSALFTSLSLLAVMTLALYLLRDVLRKKMPQTAASSLRVKERLRISPKVELYVVQFDGRELLIGHSAEALVKLAEAFPPLNPDHVPAA